MLLWDGRLARSVSEPQDLYFDEEYGQGCPYHKIFILINRIRQESPTKDVPSLVVGLLAGDFSCILRPIPFLEKRGRGIATKITIS